MADMNGYTRVLVVARERRRADELTAALERAGFLVTSTTSAVTALDLAAYSDFDAVIMAEDMPAAERRYLRAQAIARRPNIVVVSNRSARSAVLQMRQAFKEARAAAAE